ncbi:MAG: DNA polymerase [Myxococcaceae bacterium]|nr:DNA polymerase [Myxococcaceae bacterium]
MKLIFDIETNGLLDQLDRIHCLVIRDADTGEVVHNWSSASGQSPRPALYDLEMAAEIIGHNIIGFDIPALQKCCPDFKPKGRVTDTLVMARALFPKERLLDSDFRRISKKKMPGNLAGSHSLQAWGYRLCDYKGDYKGGWETWNQEMQDYCVQDTQVTLALYNRLRKEADTIPNSSVFLDLEHAVTTIVVRQERHGFLFDMDKARALLVKLVKRRDELEAELTKAFPAWWVPRGQFVPKKDNKKQGYTAGVPLTKVELVTFNPASRHHIADRLQRVLGWKPKAFTPSGQPLLDEGVLNGMTQPEAKLLAEYLMVQKRIAQLADGDEALIRHVKADGRIHGSVNPNGAHTGRMTHSRPNMAQVPGGKSAYGHEFRECLIVRPGYKLVGCDADALELRDLAGYMAAYDGGAYIDVVLKGDKAKGTDMHSVNARALGLDPKQVYSIDGKQLTGRDIAKVWFYAFIYGAGDQKLGEIQIGGRDEEKQRRVGKKARASFLKNLPALGRLTARVQEKCKSPGFLVGLDKRRLYPRSAHAALNTLLQSAGAVMMKKALVILDDRLQASGLAPGVDYEFVANVHDEWQLEVKEEYAEQVGKTAREAIVAAGEAFKFRCPLDGNYVVGTSWAETH